MEQLAAAGFTWVRMDFTWEATERGPGVYDFSAYERLLSALEAKGIRALFILDYGNRLYDEGLAPHTEAGRQAFARWAAAAVKQFAGRDIIWEMWNEPNIGFWKPEPNPPDYIALALAVGKAVRAAQPDACYVGPATSGVDFNFLEQCFQAGLLDYWDGVTVHPYRSEPPETAIPDYERLRALLAAYGPKGKQIPILSGEWGYTATRVGPELQGKYLARQWLSNLLAGVPLSIWYDWHDDGPDPNEGEHNFGTVAYDYSPKPAYRAAQTLTSALRGLRFQARLTVGDSDDFILSFAEGERRVLVAWTVGAAHQVPLPLAEGHCTVISMTGESQEASVGPEGLRLLLTDAPQYLTPK